MAGEIHGQIFREDAWHMWAPYGERAFPELDNLLNPDEITPREAVEVLEGASRDAAVAIVGRLYYGDLGIADDWSQTWDKRSKLLRNAAEQGLPDKVFGALVAANDEQNHVVQPVRERTIADGPKLLHEIGRAVTSLAQDGYWTKAEAETIHARLIAPDGNPLIQLTPMTRLEVLRHYIKQGNGDEPVANFADATDLKMGIILSPYKLWINEKVPRMYNVPHEHGHAVIAGSEFYDVTLDDGRRRPQPTALGLLQGEPTTTIWSPASYEGTDYMEANEAWTEDVAYTLMLASNGLRKYMLDTKYNSYWPWVTRLRELRTQHPTIQQEITRAALIEPTRQNPDAKKEALARMHKMVDHELDMSQALNTVFRSAKTISDIFPGQKAN